MKIKLDKQSKIEMLKAIQIGILDTDKISELKTFIDNLSPSHYFEQLSDEELDQKINDLAKKLNYEN